MLVANLIGPATTPGSLILDQQPRASSSRIPSIPSPAESSKGRSVGPDGDELVWSGRRLIWSRGIQIHRQYTYEREEEDIAFALFAHFPSPSTASGKGKEVDVHLSDTFGPFQTSHSATWGAPSTSTSSTSTTSKSSTAPALVVFLQTRAHIYFPSGEDVDVQLPYVIEKAWALPLPSGGVMVQRVLDRREKRRLGKGKSVLSGMTSQPRGKARMSVLDGLGAMEMEPEAEHTSQPRLSVLMSPVEEFKAVVEGTVQVSGDGHVLRYSDNIDSDRTVLFSAAEGFPPFVILHSRSTGQIIFTRRVSVPVTPATPEPEPPAMTPRTMRPSDILAPDPPPAPAGRPRPSLRRNPSSAFGTDTNRRVSGMADPLDRAHRRAPRLSRAIEAHPGPGELQRTLEPASLPVVPPAMSKMATRAEEKRRESGASVIMREDLDMAGRRALHVQVADEGDWRGDATMLMGLEREEVQRSEVVLDRIWQCTPPAGFDPSTLSVFLSDNLSPSSIVINIHSPELQQLFTFQATHHAAGDRWQTSERSVIPSLSAVPLISTRPDVLDTLNLDPDGTLRILTSFDESIPLALPISGEGDDVAHKLAQSLHMTIDTDERMGSDESTSGVVGLRKGKGSEFVAVLRNGEAVRCSADFTLKKGVTRSALEALSYAWPADAFFALKSQFLVDRITAGREGEWETFARTLRTAFGLSRQSTPLPPVERAVQQCIDSSDPLLARLAARCRSHLGETPLASEEVAVEPTSDPSLIPSALMALHLVGQDCRLSLRGRREMRGIAGVMCDLSTAVGRLDWCDYWMRIVPSHNAGNSVKRYDVDTSVLDVYQQPPDILAYLTRRLSRPIKPFPSPSTFFNRPSEYGTPEPCGQTQPICDIFDLIGPPSSPADAIDRAYATAQLMVDRQLGVEWLADRPACIALPILETMKLCQMVPRRNVSSGVYDLIGRLDLEMQMKGGEDLPYQPEHDTIESMPSVGDLMRGTIKRAEPLGLPHVRFGADRRLREVERIMQASRIRSINLEMKTSSDAELAQFQQAMVNTIAQRTLAVLVGQGIFEYGTRNTAITDVWEIPLIELSVKLSPTNTLLKAQIHGEHVDWPCFHNGVSAGLSISADCKGIDSAWIVLNKPTPLNPEHGGFLLGLGLTGHLRKLKTYHAFPYMEARHDFTSVGLLLGLASSYAGSQDILITKTLSLHTHALLPLGSMALNAPPIVQSSALVGLGLVYAGSKNLRMAEVTLAEVGRKEMGGIENFSDYQEAYSFSAAAAFGLIMLARGGQAASEVDRRMLGTLRRCIHGDGPDLRKGLTPIDTTITGAGATLALGLMYLKSNRTDIRDILEIPSTALALDLIRPDLLLLRTFARGLIMWDSITPALTWIEDQLPPFILSQVKGHKFVGGLELATDLAYINIIAGACLAIGLKFAGTASELAHNNLMLLYHVLARSAGSGGMAYEAKIRRSAARQALNIVSIAICCVMSGTGELQVLRRLRISHGQEGVGVTYGTHMAMHMAVGLLFLGKGQFTLGTSNLAIAAMSIAFFPRFMHTPDDNRAYPQAFRHLWALAAEPRCLMARDVDTGETVYLPIKVKLKEGETIRSQNLISPTLIAPFESLVSIEVDSPRYWPITYTFTDPIHRAALVRTRTIHVKRRAGHQDYNSDPKGNRSIFIRAGGVTGFDLHYDLLSLAAPPSIPPAETLELIQQHSPYYAVLAGIVGGDNPYERFIRTVLLECVTLDKPLVLSVYMGLLADQRGWGAEKLREVEMLRSYYAGKWDGGAGVSGTGEKRVALLRPAFLAALTRRGGDVDEDAERAYLTRGEWTGGEALAQWLVKDKVPGWPLLQALKEKVQTTGGDRSTLAVKVREVAKVYEANLGRVWDLDAGDVRAEAGGWKAESVGRAVSAWLT